jgi:ABC-type multidrug transport system ATPase subunit
VTIVATNLSFGYADRTIGAGVDVVISGGAALALLGPNGGGKTTLLKTLMGLIPAQGGAISIDAAHRLCAAGPCRRIRVHGARSRIDGPHRAWRRLRAAGRARS